MSPGYSVVTAGRATSAATPNVASEVEGAAVAGVAVEPHAAAHQRRPARRDGEARGRCRRSAAWSSRRPAEGLEDERLLLARDADAGVADGEVQHGRRWRRAGPRGSRAATWPLSVNLMALPTRLMMHLPQPQRIADRSRPARRAPMSTDQLEALRSARERERLQRFADEVARARTAPTPARACATSIFEKSRMSLRMPSSDSADRVHRLEIVALRRRSARYRARARVMPMTPFIGVRISWLMFARNSLLARLASSAASRASRSARSTRLCCVMSRAIAWKPTCSGARTSAGRRARAGCAGRSS